MNMNIAKIFITTLFICETCISVESLDRVRINGNTLNTIVIPDNIQDIKVVLGPYPGEFPLDESLAFTSNQVPKLREILEKFNECSRWYVNTEKLNLSEKKELDGKESAEGRIFILKNLDLIYASLPWLKITNMEIAIPFNISDHITSNDITDIITPHLKQAQNLTSLVILELPDYVSEIKYFIQHLPDTLVELVIGNPPMLMDSSDDDDTEYNSVSELTKVKDIIHAIRPQLKITFSSEQSPS